MKNKYEKKKEIKATAAGAHLIWRVSACENAASGVSQKKKIITKLFST